MAAAATMFAACSQNEVLNEVQVQDEAQAIGFSTYAGKVTRAENSYETEVQGLSNHHESFIVWGYKNTTTDYVFKAVPVTYQSTAQSTAWTYSPTKYWDKAAKTYEFYAAAPNNGVWVLKQRTDAQNDDYFTYSNLELKDETHSSTAYQESFKTLTQNKDLMIASPKQVVQYQILGHEKVKFDFNHILSRLNITVKKDGSLAGEDVVLGSIFVKELINIASFSEETAAVAGGTTARWTKTDNKYNLTGNGLASVTDAPLYVLQSLVIPQTAAYQDVDRDGSTIETAPYLYLEYTIGGEPFKATYNLANAFGVTSEVAFNEGWQNTLNITLKADKIEFEAEVFNWEDGVTFEKVID